MSARWAHELLLRLLLLLSADLLHCRTALLQQRQHELWCSWPAWTTPDNVCEAHASCAGQDLRNSMHSYRSWLAEQWQLLSANEGALLRQARPDWPNSLLCITTSLLRCCDPEVR